MKKVKLITLLTTLLLIIASIFNFGLSSFISGASLDVSIKDAPRVVCYTGDNKFTTIEKALEFATNKENINVANTIYVIPGTNPTITKDCTIDEKDTLCLPYEGKTWDFREGPSTLNNRFADDCEAMVTANRKSLVTIKRGVTLTVNGTLQIGGILGNASVGYQGLQGQTSGSYAEILMEAGNTSLQGAKIQVSANGSIDCRGYIKETEISDNPNIQPQLILDDSSNLQLPFVIYDFQGANATGGIFLGSDSIGISSIVTSPTITKDGYACPFSLFDFPNIQISTKINSGANVVALVSLHTNAVSVSVISFEESWNNDSFVVVGGENSLITINSGYITVRYKPANLGYTEVIYYPVSNTRTTVEFFGDCNFGSLQMTLNAQIAKVKINTSKILFPFSYRWAFRIKNGGTVNINNGIKFMNGCYLEIENGGCLELQSGAKVILYNQTWTDHKTTIPYIPTYSKDGTQTVATLQDLTTSYNLGVTTKTPSITGEALLINNGLINMNSGISFGGNISSSAINGVISYLSGATNEISSLETNGNGRVADNKLSYVFSHVNPQFIKENGTFDSVNDFTNIQNALLTEGSFSSINLSGNYAFGTVKGSSSIIGDSTILPNASKTYTITDNSSHLLGDSFIWSCSDTSKLNLNATSGKSITATGVSSGEVTLTCKIYYQNNLVYTANKTITVEKEPYANISVSVDTSNILDDPDSPFSIGGIRDYREITVTLDTNCTNYSLNWTYNTSLFKVSLLSSSYPVYKYKFETIYYGDDTLKLSFTSDEITKNDCWTQDVSIANNLRVTSIVVNPSSWTGDADANLSYDYFTMTGDITTDGNITNIAKEDKKTDTNAKVNSISLSGSTLTLNCSGRSIAWQSYTTTFYVYTNNGVNGNKVLSNLLTFKIV